MRRERDSNPRYSFEHSSFRNCPIHPLWHPASFCGPDGARTHNPYNAIVVLYQLSYRPSLFSGAPGRSRTSTLLLRTELL